MFLSVIIPTRNRSSLLRKTLESITVQTMDKNSFEVIVIDNASSDNTKAVSESFTNKLNLKYIYEKKIGLHEGRHTGIRNSKGEILTFIDDDIQAFSGWLRTIYTIFKANDKVVLVGGKNLPNFEKTPPEWILRLWNQNTDVGQILTDLSLIDLGDHEKEIQPNLVFGCNFSIRKNIVLEAGGFNPDGMPFELIRFRGDGETYVSSYINKRGYLAYYHPNASVYHWVSKDRMSEEYFCKRRFMQGVSDAYTKLRSKKKYLINFKRVYFNLKKIYSYFWESKKNYSQIAVLNESNEIDFDKKLQISYKNGYLYLQECYNNDIEVFSWVHRRNYL